MAAAPPPPAPPRAGVPYDHLFKVLMIGDAGVGKVCKCMHSITYDSVYTIIGIVCDTMVYYYILQYQTLV